MNDGFQIFDIVLFAVLALFLIYRLGSVLGRRGEDQGRQADPFSFGGKPADSKDDQDNVVSMPNQREPTQEELDAMDPVDAGLARIMAADPAFRDSEFVKGARVAFEMILEAFAKGDGKTLKSLLDAPVYENFSAAIREREKAGHELETTLVGIEDSEIADAAMEGSVAKVTVKFVTNQVNCTRDADGEVVDGHPNAVVTVTDIWTFSRDTKSRDPNWLLVATGTSD